MLQLRYVLLQGNNTVNIPNLDTSPKCHYQCQWPYCRCYTTKTQVDCLIRTKTTDADSGIQNVGIKTEGNLTWRDLGIDGRAVRSELDSTGSRQSTGGIFCTRQLIFGYHKKRMILDLLTESQLLKKGCAPRSKFNIVIR
jgi:hypothetical protein